MNMKLCTRCITVKKIEQFYEMKKDKKTFKKRLRCSTCRMKKLITPKSLIIYFN